MINITIDKQTKNWLDFDSFVFYIFKMLVQDFGFLYPAIFLLDKQSGGLIRIKDGAINEINKVVKKFSGLDIDDLCFRLEYNDNIIVQSFLDNKILETNSSKFLARPYGNDLMFKSLDKILRLRLYCTVPIIASGEKVGVITFGSRDKKSLSKFDKNVLNNFVTELGGYLYASWQISVLNKENEFFKKKLEDKNKLNALQNDFLLNTYNIFKELIKSKDVNSDMKKSIEESTQYLKSLVLLSEIVDQNEYE